MPKKSNGIAGMSFEQIMVQQATQAVNKPVYCRVCGKNLKEPSSESRFNQIGDNTGNYASEWEIKNSVHTSCAQRHVRGGRR
jgi:hypothetical protein